MCRYWIMIYFINFPPCYAMLLYKSRVLIASVMHGIFYILPVLNLTLGYGNDGRLSIVRDTVIVQL